MARNEVAHVMVRRIDVNDATIGDWTAIDSMLEQQMKDGTFEDTAIVLWWSSDVSSFALGCWLDADNFDANVARKRGCRVGRHHSFGGSIGMYDPSLPVVVLWLEDRDRSGPIVDRFNANGEATAAALRDLGMDAEYRPVGDIEVEQDGVRYKVAANAVNDAPVDGHIKMVSSLIWDSASEELFDIMETAQRMPAEKFEDKETDSLTTRVRPITDYLEGANLEVTVDDAVDSVLERNVSAFLGADESIVEYEWDEEERSFLESMKPFFESNVWYERVSTSNVCRRMGGREVGVAAYKSRKLVNASVFLDDDGSIYDVLISGDFYARYVPTVTEWGAIRDIRNSLRGLDPSDTASVTAAVSDVFDHPDVEILGVEAADIAETVSRAAANTQPVEEYLASFG